MPSAYQSSLELKPTTYKNHCKKLEYLVEKQKEMCTLNYNVLHIVSRGAKLGIDECQRQFHMNRWNCTTYDSAESKVFGGVLETRKSFMIIQLFIFKPFFVILFYLFFNLVHFLSFIFQILFLEK